jgi:hypothetical protein
MSEIKEILLTELKQDSRNANKGKAAGNEKLSKSVQRLGLGRGILVDKDLNIIAGNHATAEAIKQGYKKAVIVETTGDTLVITKRTDVELDSKKGRELAISDNVTAKEGIDFDFDVLDELNAEFDIDMDFMPEVDLYSSQTGNETDYSEKNKEIDTDSFEDKCTITLNYTMAEYEQVKAELYKIAQTPEAAIWKLLKLDEND